MKNYILTGIGILGIIIGIWSIINLKKIDKYDYVPSYWKKLRASVFIFALLLGISTWPGTFFMGYSLNEKIRAVGIPFIVAYFDSDGRDYLSSFALFSIVMNGLFWFALPNILLSVYSKKIIRKTD